MVSTTPVLALTTIVGTDSVDLVTHMSTGISQKMENLLTGAAYPNGNLVIDFNSTSNRTLTLKNTGGGGVGLVANDKGSQIYNVKSYGAVGDGATNDYTAINAAISAASSAGGGMVFFPSTASSYAYGTGLTIPVNVSLNGVGAGSTLKYTGATNAIVLDPGSGTIAQQRSLLRNFRLTTSTGAKGIVLKDVYEIRLDNVIVDGFSNAGVVADATAVTGGTFVVFLTGCYLLTNGIGLRFISQNLHNQWTLVGCRIQGSTVGAGIQADQTVKGLTVVGCDIEGNTGAEFLMSNGAEALTVTGNWFETNTGTNNGIVLQGAGAYLGCRIESNRFVNNIGAASGRALYLPCTAAIPYVGFRFNSNIIGGYGNAINPAVDCASKRFDESDLSTNFFSNSVTTPYGNLPAATSNGTWLRAFNTETTLNFDLSAVTTQDLTVPVTGAVVGDLVALGVPNGSVTADTLFWAWVSAADTVTIRAMRTAGTPDPASGLFKVAVWKRN